MVVVNNWHGLFGEGTLKSVVSQESSWFFACWYKIRITESHFNNYYVDVVKNGSGILGNGTLKLGVSKELFYKLS